VTRTTAQITNSRQRPERLRRADLRKASGFPANPVPFALLRAGRKAKPSGLRGGGCPGGGPPERRSLSASQAAEPQVVAVGNKHKLDKRG